MQITQTETAGARTQIELGTRVLRVNTDRSYNGKTGRVFEINPVKERARIEWDGGSPRTWIGFRFLQII